MKYMIISIYLSIPNFFKKIIAPYQTPLEHDIRYIVFVLTKYEILSNLIRLDKDMEQFSSVFHIRFFNKYK